MHLRIVLGVELCIRLAFIKSRVRVRVMPGLPFGLESSAFRVRVSVGIDDLELVSKSSTLGLDLCLESSAFRI